VYNKDDWLKNQEKTEKAVVKYESEGVENEMYMKKLIFSDYIHFI